MHSFNWDVSALPLSSYQTAFIAAILNKYSQTATYASQTHKADYSCIYIPSARVRRSDIVLWTGGISPSTAEWRHLSSGRSSWVLHPAVAAGAAASRPSRNVETPSEMQRRSLSHADSTFCVLTREAGELKAASVKFRRSWREHG